MAKSALRRTYPPRTVIDFPSPPSRIAELITELALLPALSRGNK